MEEQEIPVTTEDAQTESAVAVQSTEPDVAEATKPATKTKKNATGNLIFDVANEIEGLSKVKALHLADALVNDVDTAYFKLGGVLKIISDNSWFDGFDSFGAYCFEKFAFQERKGRYLIQIYTDLVTKQIPGEKVLHLGWTKLKMLSGLLTVDNVDEWVEKAEKLSVSELAAMLKGSGEGEGEQTSKTTEQLVKVPLKFHPDQFTVWQQGIAKAKGELQTDYDTVAAAAIVAGYLGGNTGLGDGSAPTGGSFTEIVTAMGFQAALTKLNEVFPEWNIEATEGTPAA